MSSVNFSIIKDVYDFVNKNQKEFIKVLTCIGFNRHFAFKILTNVKNNKPIHIELDHKQKDILIMFMSNMCTTEQICKNQC